MNISNFYKMRLVGLEPTRRKAQEPKSCTSANSVITAYYFFEKKKNPIENLHGRFLWVI